MATRGLNPSTFSPRPIGKGQPGSYIDGPDPYYQPTWMLRGITKDANGAVLPGVTVDVFRALIPCEWMGRTVSLSDGSYAFPLPDAVTLFFAVSYLDGVTPVAGTTLRTLVGEP